MFLKSKNPPSTTRTIWEVPLPPPGTTMGKTPDKHVALDYMTLGFVQYLEQ